MNKKALVIGIDEYSQTPLHSCCNDAESIKQLLSENEDKSPNFEVKCIKNVKTKGELYSHIEECFNGDSETSLFYYSGHGYINSFGGYLVTPDYSTNNYGVAMHDILNIVNRSKCRNKIVILDCCYSGAMGEFDSQSQNLTIIGEGVTILTASRKTEPSVEGDSHGLFTGLLIEALSGYAADLTGHITPGNIYAYIDRALGPWDQRPVFKTNITRFVSLRQVNPQVDIKIIRNICTYFPAKDYKFQLDPSFETTNSPEIQHKIITPYANIKNTKIFSELQQLEGIGLIVPNEEKHMYFAAMNSKTCVLTALGKQYWELVKKKKI